MVKVSIVMGVYNDEVNLEKTINSILSQTYTDWELLVVNDGSTDNTPFLLNKLARNDERVKIIQQSNMGLTKALIRGCEEAIGEFIARQDSGDISFPTRLEEQVKVLEQDPSVSLVSSFTKFVAPQQDEATNYDYYPYLYLMNMARDSLKALLDTNQRKGLILLEFRKQLFRIYDLSFQGNASLNVLGFCAR